MVRALRIPEGMLALSMLLGQDPIPVRRETPLIARMDVLVEGSAERAELRLDARVAFLGSGRAVRFHLGSRHVVERVEDEAGQSLSFTRDGDIVSVSLTGPDDPSRRREWRFLYTWPLERPLAQLGGVLGGPSWHPAAVEAGPGGRGFPASVRFHLPDPFVGVSAGTLRTALTPSGRAFEWTSAASATRHPLVVSRFVWREERRGRTFGRVFVPPELEPRTGPLLSHVLSTATFFEDLLGPSGRDDYALAALPLPRGQRGMTWPGLILATMSDLGPEDQFPSRVLAHEMAHHWWSHLVAFPRADDVWLLEGLPTYCALLFVETHEGPERFREERRHSRGIALRDATAPPLGQGSRLAGDLRYTQAYHKAAFVLHMLRTLTGRDALVATMRDVLQARGGSTAGTADFKDALSRHAPDPTAAAGLVDSWLQTAALPRFTVSHRIEGAESGPWRVVGEVQQEGARILAPLRLRVRYADRTATADLTLIVKPGRTSFRIDCEAPPSALEADPDDDLLHAGLRVTRD